MEIHRKRGPDDPNQDSQFTALAFYGATLSEYFRMVVKMNKTSNPHLAFPNSIQLISLPKSSNSDETILELGFYNSNGCSIIYILKQMDDYAHFRYKYYSKSETQ